MSIQEIIKATILLRTDLSGSDRRTIEQAIKALETQEDKIKKLENEIEALEFNLREIETAL